MLWILVFAAGVLTGLRTFMPLAVLTLFAVHRQIPFDKTPFAFLGRMWVHIPVTLLAIGELVGDKLPRTPSRTALPGLTGRFCIGATVGAALAIAKQSPWWEGALIAAIGAIVGAYAGWFARTRTVAALHCPDWVVAVVEDVVTIGGSILVMLRVEAL